MKRNLVTVAELKREFPWLTNWLLLRLRKTRKIPYVKVGHRSFLYDLERVAKALEKFEVEEVS